jgi:hypothetical protein
MNKKLAILASFLMLSGSAFAISTNIFLSSNTTTADTTKNLCVGTVGTFGTWGNHGVIHAACVNTGAAGTLTVYNSSATATNPIFALDTTAKGCQVYDVAVSSGLTYTNSATANVTLLYQCY